MILGHRRSHSIKCVLDLLSMLAVITLSPMRALFDLTTYNAPYVCVSEVVKIKSFTVLHFCVACLFDVSCLPMLLQKCLSSEFLLYLLPQSQYGDNSNSLVFLIFSETAHHTQNTKPIAPWLTCLQRVGKLSQLFCTTEMWFLVSPAN